MYDVIQHSSECIKERSQSHYSLYNFWQSSSIQLVHSNFEETSHSETHKQHKHSKEARHPVDISNFVNIRQG